MMRLVPRVIAQGVLLLSFAACGNNSSGGDDGASAAGVGGSAPVQGGRGGEPVSSAGMPMGGFGAGGTNPQGGRGNAGSSGGGQGGIAGTPGTGGTSGSGGAPLLGGGGTGGPSSGGGVTGGTAGTAGTGGSGGIDPLFSYVYVGTGDFGKTGAGKVRAYTLDETTLKLSSLQTIEAGTLPSHVTLNPLQTGLFAADEDEGKVRAFSISSTGQLTALNSKTGGGHPVFLSVDGSGKYLLAANYNEGNVDVFPINGNQLGDRTTSGMSTGNQAHSIVPSPDNAYVFVPNKGSNYIRQLKFDAATGKLSANTPENVMAEGGPRHFAFHPTKPFAYAITELGNTLRAYSFDAAKGTLTEIDSKTTLASGSSGNSTGGDVRVEPTGKFVYGSNRNGANSNLVAFSIDQTTGKLTLVGHTPAHGNTPRVFAIHPNGTSLFVAHADANTVASFRLDPSTGALTFVETTDVGDRAFCVTVARKAR